MKLIYCVGNGVWRGLVSKKYRITNKKYYLSCTNKDQGSYINSLIWNKI